MPIFRHNEKREYKKDPKLEAFYKSKAWRATRQVFLANNPLCKSCLESGKTVAAKDVHHKTTISTSEGWAKRLDLEGLEAQCHSCHSKITRKESKLK